MPVVSDDFDRTPLGQEWQPYTSAAPYPELAETCRAMLSDIEEAQNNAIEAFAAAKKNKSSQSLLADAFALPALKTYQLDS